ncbi:hypothetical protein K2Y11_13960 [bacterium]|nr:hypothetical protein [bacterium]
MPSIFLVSCLAFSTITADLVVPIEDGVRIHFLDRVNGAAAVTSERNDPFFRELSTIDLEARLGQPLDGVRRTEAVARLKKLFESSVVDWTQPEVDAVTQACREVLARSKARAPGFVPSDWKFVKTSGEEEGGAAYTRGDTIILSASKLAAGLRPLARLVAHETCHVYGRLHPETRKDLFKRLGFRVVGPVDLGDAIGPRRLTNPDSPVTDAIIRVKTPEGVEFDAAMVLYSSQPRFNPQLGRGVFPYLKFGLVPVAENGGGEYRVAGSGASLPQVYAPEAVAGFFEQVGRNTRYILGPDEILAENLAILLSSDDPTVEATDPRIPQDLGEIVRGSREAPIGSE